MSIGRFLGKFINLSNLRFNIFASYSHEDEKIVQQLINFLRPSYSVFLDKENITPGQQWMVVIDKAIENCRAIYIFWCTHSAQSYEVKKEYEKAISLKKSIIPVIMDKTPLPEKLGVYQWVDFSNLFGKHGGIIEIEPGQSHQHIKNDQIESAAIELKISRNDLQSAVEMLNTNIENQIRTFEKKKLAVNIYSQYGNIISHLEPNPVKSHKIIKFGDVIKPITGIAKHNIDNTDIRFNVGNLTKEPNEKPKTKGPSDNIDNLIYD